MAENKRVTNLWANFPITPTPQSRRFWRRFPDPKPPFKVTKKQRQVAIVSYRFIFVLHQPLFWEGMLSLGGSQLVRGIFMAIWKGKDPTEGTY